VAEQDVVRLDAQLLHDSRHRAQARAAQLEAGDVCPEWAEPERVHRGDRARDGDPPERHAGEARPPARVRAAPDRA